MYYIFSVLCTKTNLFPQFKSDIKYLRGVFWYTFVIESYLPSKCGAILAESGNKLPRPLSTYMPSYKLLGVHAPK